MTFQLNVISGTLVNGRKFVKIDTRQLEKPIKIKIFGVMCEISIENHNICPFAKIVEGEVFNGEGIVSYTNK